MAGGTIWTGIIHVGDLQVPVKLHPAVQETRIQFHLLHQRDQVRLQQQMICDYEKVPVPLEEQVKGFELEERKYLLVDPALLHEIEPAGSRMIEVREFVKSARIDPIFLERAYYLEPDRHLADYNALAAALQELEAAGICTWTMRKRSYLGALQARANLLRLHILRHADEVVPVQALDLQKYAFSAKELDIGGELINRLTVGFEPQKFANEHQKKLQDLIAKKARQEKIGLLRPRRLQATAPDKLLEALEASLQKVA